MKIHIHFNADKEYYEEAWYQLVELTRFRKYVPYWAIGKIAFGLVFYYLDKQSVIGVWILLFCASGVYDIYKLWNEKRQWMKDRMDSKIFEQAVEFEFNEDGIIHKGPFGHGELSWGGMKTIKSTTKGVVLKWENASSVYIPSKAFRSNEEIRFLLSKLNE